MPNGKKGFPSVRSDRLEWVMVRGNTPADMQVLRNTYRFHALDLKEILPPLQRPKVITRDDYLFMILHYPIYDEATKDVRTTEVNLFISEHRLVTVNTDGYAPLLNLFQNCQRSSHVCLEGDITQLLHALLSDMTAHVFSLLVRINGDLDAIETRMFEAHERNLIQNLLRTKTNIVEIRKALQPHQNVMTSFIRLAPRHFPLQHLQDYFDELVDDAKEIWETLSVQKETVDALHDTNQSLIDFRSNQIMKTLTIFSVTMLPLTLLASLYGMNVLLPFGVHPHAFWMIAGLMLLGLAGMLSFFKYRKWI